VTLWSWGTPTEGRSHNDALVGSMVCSTTARSFADSVSRSTCSRRRALNASMVVAAAVEAPLNHALDAASRLEQGGHGQRGAGDRPARRLAADAAEQVPQAEDHGGVDGAEQGGEQRMNGCGQGTR
jgi:hypothetical protein